MKENRNLTKLPLPSLLFLVLCIVITSSLTFLLYSNTKDFFESSIREHIISIVRGAALQFIPADLKELNSHEDTNKLVYKEVVSKLEKIKQTNKNIRFIYIQKKTDNPEMLEFVADADAIDPENPIDFNGNGIIDTDEELSLPGDEYDVSEYPRFIEIAFTETYIDEELSVDQWGAHLSATSPINAEYLIGIDVDVSDYLRETTVTLREFIGFIFALLIILSGLTFVLIKIWGTRVALLQDLDRQKDELLGIVAHQLAKPITAIRWDLESFLDGDLGELNAQQKEETTTMRTQAVNLADLVSMILDVSRIQLGKINLTPQPLDLNQLFKEMLDVIQPTIKQKKLNFIKNMPASIPTALLDKRYTRMTIENLLTNAVKYTPDGGTVTLNVTVENGIMHCSVADTGCGIPKEEQGKIFGKMYRASNVRNTVEGNGFGLYVAKGAIEGQGGKMWFTSEVGKGTTFFFDLPLKEAPKA